MKKFLSLILCFVCAISVGLGLGFGLSNDEPQNNLENTVEAAATTAKNASLWPSSRAVAPSGGGSSSDPYKITSAGNLIWLREQAKTSPWSFNKYFKQTADINLSEYYWEPIGTKSAEFMGKYYGDGYSIIGLFIDNEKYPFIDPSSSAEDLNSVGLFGFANCAEFNGIITRQGKIKAEATYVGAICGKSINTVYYKCGNFIDVDVYAAGGACYVGGIVGDNECKHLTIYDGAVVVYCYNFGNITDTNHDFHLGSFGGIIGAFISEDNAGLITTIAYNYNAGNLTVIPFYCGGIVGMLNKIKTVKNNFNVGKIESIDKDGNIKEAINSGAIFGSISASENCYMPSNNYADPNCGVDIVFETSSNLTFKDGTFKLENGVKDNSLVPGLSDAMKKWESFSSSDLSFTANGTKYYWADKVQIASETWGAVFTLNPKINNGFPYFNFEKFPNLHIDPNGGSFEGSSSIKTINPGYGVETTLSVPTRSGYTFKGWMTKNGDGTLSTFGKTHEKTTDGCFDWSLNNVEAYNNNGGVSVSTVTKPSDSPLVNAKNVLRVSMTGKVGWGSGFHNYFNTSANKVYYQVICAKIPVGYNLGAAYNAHGDNPQDRWLTVHKGTGTWKTYIYKWVCGGSGTFSSIGYFYLEGPSGSASNPVVWDVAYLGTFDATDLTVTEKYNAPTTYTFGYESSTLIALWEQNATVTTNNGTSTYESSVGGETLLDLRLPEREGYIFNGLDVSGGGKIVEPQYLATEKTFNGSSDYVDLGKTHKYNSQFFFSVDAYMDNWAEFAAKDMRIVSCTEGGGWNLRPDGEYFAVSYYAIGQGYLNLVTKQRCADLLSGWHRFAVSYNESTMTLFIDRVDQGSSPAAKNGIGYHPNNSILLGAEVGDSNNTNGSFFKGKMKNVIFTTEYVTGVANLLGTSHFYLSDGRDATVTANWTETWTARGKNATWDKDENGVNLISSAAELGKLAYDNIYKGKTFEGERFKLVKNINLAQLLFQPIGSDAVPFMGEINGDGYTISGLRVENNRLAGLFAKTVDATIINVKLKDVDVSGGDYTGGLVGVATSTLIKNCQVTGSVTNTYVAGGIVGLAETLTGATKTTVIENCINDADVMGRYHGGICGHANSVTIYGCINYGTITNHESGSDYYYAGIAGKIQKAGTRIENCINYGDIINNKGVDGTAGIIGQIDDVEGAAIVSCANYGNLISTAAAPRFCSGIIARNYRAGTLIENCSSVGSLTNRGTEASGSSLIYNCGEVPAVVSSYADMTVGNVRVKQSFGSNESFNSGFRYIEGCNNNLPMQVGLFHIASEIPSQSDVYEHCLSGFTKM